ncbi:GCN5-related N-acetyltransferase 5, chloroplastic-like [Aristolochia californica]|uniref:GCN5-related N-acetyltransferase 5, chloroplastic-like n=1 Tax=Aristolochia californica TaxID=171875 RepID=UPI0035DC67F0
MASPAISLSSFDFPSQSVFSKPQHPLFFGTKPLSLSLYFTRTSPSHPLLKIAPYTLTSPLSSCPSSSPSPVSLSLIDPSTQLRFVNPRDFERLHLLEQFSRQYKVTGGSLRIAVMRAEEIDVTVQLLAESFAESMFVPVKYIRFLAFLVKQYILERRALLPHTATLIGFYQGEDGNEVLAGTVEISFDGKGANTSTPTPVPPRESPYICNMAVKQELRRKGIGWNLLEACEELISQMTIKREVFLHCRIIDTGPFQMYTKAGYKIVKTDSILAWLTFQRRKHLMCKSLPAPKPLSDFLNHGDHPISSYDVEGRTLSVPSSSSGD